MIEVRQVRKAFGKNQALRGIDLSVPRNRVTGLLGPNGAGKTTLVRILATLLRPDGGLVTVAGHDVVHEPDAVRRAIGLAGQYAVVDEILTGRENLEMTARLYKLGRAEARRRAADTLDRLSLADAADRPVKTYSGGMRRRLDLGASLVGRPAVLLLDEPTTGLDPAARNELWGLVRDLVTDGATVLLTTQMLEEADQLAEEIVFIDRGTVVAQGAPEALKTKLGDEYLDVTVGAGHAVRAVAALRPLGTQQAQADGDVVRLRAPAATALVPEVVRVLDGEGIPVTSIAVSRPSLDDIFLTLTGSHS
jgi:ABC-2 type transport system ATP-binding protein